MLSIQHYSVFYLEQLDNLNKVEQRQVNQMSSVIKSHLPARYFQRQVRFFWILDHEAIKYKLS